MAAAVGVVLPAPVREHRFLAVEEDQLDGERLAAVLERAGELEQHRGARAAVVRADEPELAEQLGVVVPADDDPVRARARQRQDHVGHVHGAERRRRDERLLGRGDAERFRLVEDVAAGLLAARRPRGARADGDELPDVLEGAPRVEGWLRRRRRSGEHGTAAGQGDEGERGDGCTHQDRLPMGT